MKRIAFQTFGCRTNQEETSAFSAVFLAQGYHIVDTLESADIIVVNGCSVTATAEAKGRRFITSLGQKYPHADICITGCFAQQNATDIALIPGIRLVVGNSMKNQLFDLVSHREKGVFCEEITVDSPIAVSTLVEEPELAKRTRFSLKIQEGCNHFCSYCIVPYLRGPSRSVPYADVQAHAKNALDAGYREIVLTGTHVGQYRDSGKTFIDILREILSQNATVRVRLSSMNPADCSDELFQLMCEEPRLCRHLHISVQSLAPSVLQKMHRDAQAIAELEERLMRYRPFLPDLNLGSDFIVGFPDESLCDFQETYDAIKRWNFSYGHVFPYSPRPNTAAAQYKDHITGEEKKRRSAVLRTILKENHEYFCQNQIGENVQIIIEENGIFTGMSGNYLRVRGEHNPIYKKNQVYTTLLQSYDTTREIFSVASISPSLT